MAGPAVSNRGWTVVRAAGVSLLCCGAAALFLAGPKPAAVQEPPAEVKGMVRAFVAALNSGNGKLPTSLYAAAPYIMLCTDLDVLEKPSCTRRSLSLVRCFWRRVRCGLRPRLDLSASRDSGRADANHHSHMAGQKQDGAYRIIRQETRVVGEGSYC